MGGKQFKKEMKRDEIKQLPYSTRLQQLEKELNILQDKIITVKFRQDNKIKDTYNPSKDEIEKIVKDNEERAKEEGLTNIFNVFSHYLCQGFVERYVVVKHNIFKTLNEIIDKCTLSKEEKEKLNLLKELFEKEFDQESKLVKYNYFNSIKFINLKGIHSNLLFNAKLGLQPDIITVIVDDVLLDNLEQVKGISDVIANCPTLTVVNYILYPRNRDGQLAEEFGLDGQTYQSLYALIKAVTVNRNVKSFVLHSIEYYNLNLAPEIYRLIEQKLQSETLIAFHFGNFNLNESLIKKLEFLLASTKSLLFFSYENKSYTKQDVIAFKKIILKNRSIRILSIITPIFKGMKESVIQKIKKKLNPDNKESKLEIIYLNHQSLIERTWFAPNQKNY